MSPQKDRQREQYIVLVIKEIQLRWSWLVTSWTKLNESHSFSKAWWKASAEECVTSQGTT